MRPVDPVMSLIEAAQQEGAGGDGPDAVGHFLEADILLGQDMAHVHPAAVPADAAVDAHVAGLVVPGVLELPQRVGIGPRGGPVVGRRRDLAQALVRPLLVVLPAKRVEAALLAGRAR